MRQCNRCSNRERDCLLNKKVTEEITLFGVTITQERSLRNKYLISNEDCPRWVDPWGKFWLRDLVSRMTISQEALNSQVLSWITPWA